MVQKKRSPSVIFLPKSVSTSSTDEVKQSNPIRNTTKAIKNVCTVIICLLIKLNVFNSLFQLKYLGNIICIRDSIINRNPIICK